jgi:DNA modification methylase
MNQLILGDNLQIMREMPSESVDLIYLDPPFFSNRNYEVIWGDKGEVMSFEDRWSGGMEHYIGWLKERVQEMHRLIKPTGSIFLHCDWHANSYIRVFILDKIFGEQNFRNEIIWKRSDTHNDAKKQFPNVSDCIYYYVKSNNHVFNKQYTNHSEKTLKDWYQYLELPNGKVRKLTKEEKASQIIPKGSRRFNTGDMASPNPRPNLMYEYKGYPCPAKGWRYSFESMQQLDEEGKLLFPKDPKGRIMLKRYLDEQNGAVVGDVWSDISQIRANDKEKIGYPTQKPEKLLERIIEAASKEGDLIFDPFMGGGSTVVVADRLHRRWIGIDQSVQAVKITEMRLNKQQNLFSQPFISKFHKYDYDTLRYSDAFEFEAFIVQQYGGIANAKQRGDKGIDGRTRDGMPIQVKRSDDIGRNVVDNFFAAVQRYDKAVFEKNKANELPVGTIIAFSFGKGSIQEVARLKLTEGVIIKLVTVESIIEIARKPTLRVSFNDLGVDAKGSREIEFAATAQSNDSIGFFSWDWDYEADTKVFKPEVFIDRIGKQTQKFVPGFHHIAVKVVDNQGLEAIETMKLKVNGQVHQLHA